MRTKLLLLLFLLMLTMPLFAQEETDTPTPVTPTGTPDPIVEAQAIFEASRAIQQETLENINNYFTFVQALTAVIALLVIAAGGFSIWNLRELRKQIKDSEAKIAKLQSLDESVETRVNELDTLDQKVEASLENNRRVLTQQMRALSFVQFALRQLDIGNREAALRTLKEATKSDQNNPVIQFFLGEVHVRLGEVEEGISCLKKAQDQADMPDAQATLAYAYRLQGDDNSERREEHYSDALSIYNRLFREYPRLLDISGESVYGALAGLYRRQGRIERAIAVYEAIAEHTPSSSYPLNNLGLLHFEHAEKEDFADNEKGRYYFERSRRKARYALQAESADYWRLFDLITAEIALEQTQWDDIRLLIDEMMDYQPISRDLQKLYDGLLQLDRSVQSPRLVQQSIEYLKPNVDKPLADEAT